MSSVLPAGVLSSIGTGGVSKTTENAELESAQAFEAMFLGQMVDEMMKTVDMGPTMGAHSAEMWRSVLSEALAENLMEGGGLGIAQNIQQKMNAYKPQTGGSDEQS